MNCPYCNAKIEDVIEYCPNCGAYILFLWDGLDLGIFNLWE